MNDSLENEGNLLQLLDKVYMARESLYHNCKYFRPGSQDFKRASYQKWACDVLIKEINDCIEVPFIVTPEDILNGFLEKMKQYRKETPDPKQAMCFREAFIVGKSIYKDWENLLERRRILCTQSSDSKPG